MKAATHRKLAPGTKRGRRSLLLHTNSSTVGAPKWRYTGWLLYSVCICFICRLLDLLVGRATHILVHLTWTHPSSTEHLQQRIHSLARNVVPVWTLRQVRSIDDRLSRHEAIASYFSPHIRHTIYTFLRGYRQPKIIGKDWITFDMSFK